jgi:hypothetical protein
MLRLSGWLRLRMAGRQFCEVLFQEPPRTAAGAPRSRSCRRSIAPHHRGVIQRGGAQRQYKPRVSSSHVITWLPAMNHSGE